MTKKLLKIILISILLLGFCITYVSASDINLNLPGADANLVDSNTSSSNTTNNEVINQNIDSSDSNTQNDVSAANNINDTDNSFSPTETETLQPIASATQASSGLSITNIINILLIAVGVILILLAIAIIIRLK